SWNYDLTLCRRFDNNYQYNVPMLSRNKSGVKRKIEANNRKEKKRDQIKNKNPLKIVKMMSFKKKLGNWKLKNVEKNWKEKKLDNRLKKLEIERIEREFMFIYK
ncbi:hypothetical protein C1646_676025, partial [Rhizophagus diaphanus]